MKREMRNVKNCINIYEETFVTTKINECDVEYLCQEWYDRNVFALA